MNRYFIFLLLIATLVSPACRKKNEFQGHDNFITSFTLKKGTTTFTAAITDSSIVIKAPEGFSLDSAKATVTLSENATIYPSPSSIVQWGDESLFVINAYNGEKRSYKYTVDRVGISVDNSVVLATQADVDAFAARGATEITGNLIIGSTAGTDSITNLTALYKLKKVGYSLIIYPTFSATQIVGLDNLQTVGGTIQIESLNNLVKVALPALETIGSLSIRTPFTEDLEFPKLTRITKSLMVNAPLNAMSFPDLSQVGGALTLSTDNNTASALIAVISFPMLTNAGSISLSGFRQTTKLDFPELTTTGDLNLSDLTALYNISCPRLQTATGIINTPGPCKLTQLSFPALTRTGGLNISNKTINAVEFPALRTIAGDLSVISSAIDGIKDLTALTTITGRLYLGDLPKMTTLSLPPSLKTIGKLTLYNYFVTPPAEINVKGLTIGEIELQNKGTVKLIGDEVFKGTLTINPGNSASFPLLEGFSEIDSLSFAGYISYISDLQIKGIRKINKGFRMPNNNLQTFSMPDLEEVGGDFLINQLQQLSQSTVELPALTKVSGSFNVLVQSTSVTTLSCPALASVGGDFLVGTGFDDGYGVRCLSNLFFPALTSIGGSMKIYADYFADYGYSSTKITNLDGFAVLKNVRSIEISGQSMLTSFQGLQQALPAINAAGWKASGNAYNPTYEQLEAGNWTKP
jgi:hypothetical protein